MVTCYNKHANEHTNRAEQPLFAGRSSWKIGLSARYRNALINVYHRFVGS
jgi:hypothetical protein